MADFTLFTREHSLIDGESTWAQVEPTYDALFHPDVKFPGDMDKAAWKAEVEKMVAAGLVLNFFNIQLIEDNLIALSGNAVKPDGTVMPSQNQYTFKDGQIIAVAPADPSIYERAKITE